MTLVVAPTLDAVYTKLGNFIESLLSPWGVPPLAVPVIQMPENRVSMPAPSPGFVGMTARIGDRIMTNLDRWSPEAVNPTDIEIEQAVRLSVQLDCYGVPSGDWAIILSTVLRDEFACSALAPELSPLYTDSPKFAALVNGEEQYERRWIVGAVLQYNPVVSVPMQFANQAEVTLIEVDERYPP